MSKIENASAAHAQTVRVLQDDELDAVTGGLGFVERGIVIEGSKLIGDPNEFSPPILGR